MIKRLHSLAARERDSAIAVLGDQLLHLGYQASVLDDAAATIEADAAGEHHLPQPPQTIFPIHGGKVMMEVKGISVRWWTNRKKHVGFDIMGRVEQA